MEGNRSPWISEFAATTVFEFSQLLWGKWSESEIFLQRPKFYGKYKVTVENDRAASATAQFFLKSWRRLARRRLRPFIAMNRPGCRPSITGRQYSHSTALPRRGRWQRTTARARFAAASARLRELTLVSNPARRCVLQIVDRVAVASIRSAQIGPPDFRHDAGASARADRASTILPFFTSGCAAKQTVR